MPKIKLGFLASHEGTNVQAIIDACKDGRLEACPRVVISNNSKAGVLTKAKREDIPWRHLSSKTHATLRLLDKEINETLMGHRVNMVILAGYMKKLGPMTLKQYRGRILNIHPSLLPEFGGLGMYGRHVHESVINSGRMVTGVTIHLVDKDYDQGSIVAQCHVPVLKDDTPETLSERVKSREVKFYVETLQRIAAGEINL